jgi:hypothetical protein
VPHPHPGGMPHNNEEGHAPHPHRSPMPWHTTATPHRDAATDDEGGAQSCLQMTTTTVQGVDLSLATDDDAACAPDLAP